MLTKRKINTLIYIIVWKKKKQKGRMTSEERRDTLLYIYRERQRARPCQFLQHRAPEDAYEKDSKYQSFHE